jgi:hypoxanthine phosphoribosyltransferase
MSRIVIKDKTFETSIPEAEILERVSEVASRINSDMAGKNPLLLAVLNGSFVFAADLVRRLTIPCEISFVKLASYKGTGSTGDVTELIGLNCDLEGRTVVVVEDIIDSGLTMERLLATLQKYNPESVHVCTLLLKPGNLQAKLDIEYVAIEIPNDFIVGYGLDYDQAGRGLRDIYTVVDN